MQVSLLKSNLKNICEALLKLRIASVSTEYSIENGDTDHICCDTPDHEECMILFATDTDCETLELDEAIERFADAWIESDGDCKDGHGTVHIQCIGMAQLEHFEEFSREESAATHVVEDDEYSYLKSIKGILAEHNIQSVTVTFSGYGDSGDLMEVEVEPPEKIKIDVLKTIITDKQEQDGEEKDIENYIKDMTNDLIERFMPGYENNEGGGGSLTFSIEKDGEVVIVFDGYYNIDESILAGDKTLLLDEVESRKVA